MNKLFQSRLSSHLKEMFKYLRLVFNDHFVFALLILIGGLGLGYSNSLKQLSAGVWWSKPVIILALLIFLQLGQLATFLKDADVVFLLPREADIARYLTGARRYSEVLAMVYQLLGMFVLLPFIQVTDRLSVANLVMLALTQLLLKDALFSGAVMNRYQNHFLILKRPVWLNVIYPLVVLVILIYTQPIIGLVLALLGIVALRVMMQRLQAAPFDWWQAINLENNRMLRIYRFFNLFTTVPMLKGVAKRRRYLDWLLNFVKPTTGHTYLYLYSRGIVRSGEFSGLYARLTVLGMLLLYFVRGTWLPIVLGVLFLYLIGFQLIPFFWQFDDIVFTHLYPIKRQQQVANFKQLMTWLLTLTAMLFLIVLSFANLSWQISAIMLLVELVEIWFMVYYYLPLRLKKKQ